MKRCAPNPEMVARNIETACRFLAGWSGVRRVWLFGSAGKGRTLDWRSDLDFAVEGIAPGDIYALWSELDAQLTMPVDVVRWEDAPALLRSEILKGRLVWELQVKLGGTG
jgi:predicted nucleotidyltransferase